MQKEESNRRKQCLRCVSCRKAQKAIFTISAKLVKNDNNGLGSTGEIETQPAKCMHCGQLMVFRLKVKMVGVIACEQPPQDKRESYINTLPAEQREMLDRWKDNGLLQVLEDALRRYQPLSQMSFPSICKFACDFMTYAERVQPPNRNSVRQASGVEDEFRVGCYAYGCITGLVIDGRLRTFIPSKAAYRKQQGWIALNGGGSKSPVAQTLLTRVGEPGWIKTRYGYVVGQGELFDEIRRHWYVRNANIRCLNEPSETRV